jgi:hypothetical protein
MIPLALMLQLWTSTPHRPPTVFEGNWQSCRGEDGYGERVYEHVVAGKWKWELHMGPRDEFALYDHNVDGDDHTHMGAENLLSPAFHVNDVKTMGGKRNWRIPSLRLWVSIVAAGGSREDCDSFYVKIEETR